MPLHLVWIAICLFLVANAARAQNRCSIRLEGTVPDDPETHFFLPFDVPEGTLEIEIQHDDLSGEHSRLGARRPQRLPRVGRRQ